MEKDKKYMIIGIVATLFCLAVSITCAVLRGWDVVGCVLLALVAAFSIFVCVFMFLDLFKKDNKETQAKGEEENK